VTCEIAVSNRILSFYNTPLDDTSIWYTYLLNEVMTCEIAVSNRILSFYNTPLDDASIWYTYLLLETAISHVTTSFSKYVYHILVSSKGVL
jgi:hypothetical protein